eukprot:scaffold984_cov281-Chaetoceros_neogracile.AAC.3
MLRGDDLVGLADCPLSIQYHTMHYTAKAGDYFHLRSHRIRTGRGIRRLLDITTGYELISHSAQRPTHENFYVMMARSSSQQNDGRKE